MEKNKKSDQPHEFQPLLEKIAATDIRNLIAGITILSKDLAEHLASGGFGDPAAARFYRVYTQSLSESRWFRERFNPQLYLPLRESFEPALPAYAQEASRFIFELTDLNKPKIDKEWTTAPGWQLFVAFGQEFRTLLEKFKNELKNDPLNTNLDQSEKTLKLFDLIRLEGFDKRPHWIPLAMYISHLMILSCFEPIHDALSLN